MRSIFDFLTRTALRFRYVTIAIVFVVMALGVRAATQLQQELLPPVEFPQTIILAQVSGMTSEQVLTVMTERLEEALLEVPDVVNVESQTTGIFGAVIVASNEFGLDQGRLQGEIQSALDTVYLPAREIAPAEGEVADRICGNPT
ncbi:MAG: efflux RND transporter permease subunit [Anaerolineae bacterium]|nr:efflux RND transporter permease subunit [Anaerolineae bacterium]